MAEIRSLRFYRRLLKTFYRVFVTDYEMIIHVREEARRKFDENKDLSDPVDVTNAINFGEEIRDFLEMSVVQGDLQNNGNYRFKIRKEHCFGTQAPHDNLSTGQMSEEDQAKIRQEMFGQDKY